MSLHVLYRPEKLEDVVGNKSSIESLRGVLSREQAPSAFLFTGPGGTGKTTLARIVRTELKCADSDYFEMNAADERGIDAIRTLRQNIQYAPMNGPTKVILLDEAHMLTMPSQEALLKILEEPPDHVHFCICTTNPEKLKQTFKRRCHQYELKSLSMNDTLKLIKSVLKAEKALKKVKKNVALKIVELSDGSAGQALKLLDMVIDMTDPDEALDTLKSVTLGTGSPEVIDICRLLVSDRAGNVKWSSISKILKGLQSDGESARRPILAYLNKVALSKSDPSIVMMMEEFKDPFYESGAAGLTIACCRACLLEE